MRLSKGYLAFSAANLILFLAGLVLPFFASSLNASRLYQLGLIFLSPFLVIGGVVVVKVAKGLVGKPWSARSSRHALQGFSVFLALFLLFNSGLVYELARDNPTSISLNGAIDYPRFSDREVGAAYWLKASVNTFVAADAHRYQLLAGSGVSFLIVPSNATSVPADDYIFLGQYNIAHEQFLAFHAQGAYGYLEYVDIASYTRSRDLIYDNGGRRSSIEHRGRSITQGRVCLAPDVHQPFRWRRSPSNRPHERGQ